MRDDSRGADRAPFVEVGIEGALPEGGEYHCLAGPVRHLSPNCYELGSFLVDLLNSQTPLHRDHEVYVSIAELVVYPYPVYVYARHNSG